MHTNNSKGFTIVELLIVIVVIAILAAITIVAYNGIQNRANNTKTIAAAGQIVKLVKSYLATYDSYPGTANVCATKDRVCTTGAGVVNTANNTALMMELQKIGEPPAENSQSVSGNYGIQYIYESTATFNGTAAPVRIEYWLAGDAQGCGLSNVSNGSTSASVSSTTGYTNSSSGRTTCWIRIGKEV